MTDYTCGVGVIQTDNGLLQVSCKMFLLLLFSSRWFCLYLVSGSARSGTSWGAIKVRVWQIQLAVYKFEKKTWTWSVVEDSSTLHCSTSREMPRWRLRLCQATCRFSHYLITSFLSAVDPSFVYGAVSYKSPHRAFSAHERDKFRSGRIGEETKPSERTKSTSRRSPWGSHFYRSNRPRGWVHLLTHRNFPSIHLPLNLLPKQLYIWLQTFPLPVIPFCHRNGMTAFQKSSANLFRHVLIYWFNSNLAFIISRLPN